MARPRRKAPFVVTLAVAALSTACGGSTASDDGSGGSGGTGFGGFGGNPPRPPTKCPATEPIAQSTCSPVGLTCDYFGPIDSCGNQDTTTAQCGSYGWELTSFGTSCNPPPPPTDTCPVDEPTSGGYCNVLETQICDYPTTCCFNQYKCVASQWQEQSLECNPPALICPPVPPANGSACDPCALTIPNPCTWDQCFDAGLHATGVCVNGSWSVTLGPCVGGADGGAAGPGP